MEHLGRQTCASSIIDTGASASCIDEKLAKKLGLTPIDKQKVGGAAGKKLHVIYLGMIYVPTLNTHSKGRFIGVDMDDQQPVILGRDFLLNSILIYNGVNGTVSISR